MFRRFLSSSASSGCLTILLSSSTAPSSSSPSSTSTALFIPSFCDRRAASSTDSSCAQESVLSVPSAAPANSPTPSVDAAEAAKSLHAERGIIRKDSANAKELHYNRWGIDKHAVEDRKFDEQLEKQEEEEAELQRKAKLLREAAAAASGQQQQQQQQLKRSSDDFMSKFRVKTILPDKPNPDQPNRIPIKPEQPFNEAVREALDKAKILEDMKKVSQQKQQQQPAAAAGNSKPSRTKLEQHLPDAPSAPTSSTAPAPCPSYAAVGAAVPKTVPPLPGAAPPLPSMPSASGAAAAANLNPTDDDICYHLRGVIERSAAKVSADVTTLQLSLPKPMMDAIALRHGSSLRVFIAKFPARFQMDPVGLPRVHLVGVPGATATISGTQFGRSAAGGSTASPASSLSASHSAAPSAAPKPIHPMDLKKQQFLQQQKLNPASPMAAATPKSAPKVGSLLADTKFSAPALPSLPKLPGQQGAGGGQQGGAAGHDPIQHAMEAAFMTKSWRSPAEIVDNLMEYIPSYWAPMKAVHNHLPFEIKELYQNKMKLSQFLRKFNYYFDTKLTQRGAEVRVRMDCSHPKKGAADDRYGQHQRRHQLQQDQHQAEFSAEQKASTSSSPSSTLDISPAPNASLSAKTALKKPLYVEVDAHTLAGQLKQLCSNTFVPVKEFQAGLPNTITGHPEYDASAGVLPTLEKHPFIFQVVDGAVRLRQAGVAPNALEKLGRDQDDSPLPAIFAKVMQSLPSHPGDCSPVEISTVLAKLSSDEKTEIRNKYRSLPRFLRLHGAAIEVSRDNTTIRRWEEPRGSTASTSGSVEEAALELDLQSAGDVEDPFEPQLAEGAAALPKTGGVADASAVQWALKELYSGLPLSTAVPLDDAVSMLPAQMREAVMNSETPIQEQLNKYPDYFMCWASPDDEKTFIVQRTMIGVPEFELDEVVSVVKSLTPQGGIASEKLLRRVPPRMQRFLFRHGLKTTLMKRPDEFLVVNDKVLCIALKDT